jgi:hypothetical protein
MQPCHAGVAGQCSDERLEACAQLGVDMGLGRGYGLGSFGSDRSDQVVVDPDEKVFAVAERLVEVALGQFSMRADLLDGH